MSCPGLVGTVGPVAEIRASVKLALVLAGLVALLIVPARAAAAAGKPWLWQCTQIHNVEAQ